MPSIYDKFWVKRINSIIPLIEEAYINGESSELDISRISEDTEGQRRMWSGTAEFGKNYYRKISAAHALALAKLLSIEKTLKDYGATKFLLKISNNKRLRIVRL